MSDEWARTSTSLKFQLGELTLFSVHFPCLALMSHFTRLSRDPMEPRPPFEQFESGIEVAMMRAHPIEKDLPRLIRTPQAIRYVSNQYLHYYTNLEKSFADYLKGFSAKSRSTLLRKVRKFAQASGGNTAWREYALAEEMLEFHSLARQISNKTYQERLLDAGLPDDQDFLRKMHESALQGQAQGYILFLDGSPIAYIYCPVDHGTLLYQYVGYDPQYQHLSPGTVLQYLVLEKLMAQGGYSKFDFTEGQSQHKEFFSTDHVLCANILYFRPTLRNRILLYAHVFTDAFSAKLGTVLERLGLKARIKKLLRAKA